MTTPAMTTRERFQAVMNFQPFDRLPLVEWAGWWTETVDRWVGEGLPAALRNDGAALRRWWGLDVYYQDWIGARRPGCPTPAHHGAGLIADERDYERIRPYLYPWPCVDRARWQAWAEEQRRGDVVLWYTLEGFFWFPRTLFGIENHLYAFYDQPALMHRINRDLTDWLIRVVDEIKLDEPKTKNVARILKALGIERTCLVALPQHDAGIERAARNIERATLTTVPQLNAWDLLQTRTLVTTKAGLEAILA